MSEWKKVKLGELYEVHNGLSKGRQFFGSGYPLTFSTVFNNYFLPKELDSLAQSSEKETQSIIRKTKCFFFGLPGLGEIKRSFGYENEKSCLHFDFGLIFYD
ncbi:MAG: hypothetical protein IJ775_03130 [Muribaculaceae bacterium]|nr:hypothetical protein [Muribaculaceae bacterium]